MTHPRVLDADLLRSWPLPLAEETDKFERGSVLVVGGSSRTPGAVVLAGTAALRAGAGRLQIATVASVSAALAVAVPEALVEPLPETGDGAIDPLGRLEPLGRRVARADAVVVGCGMADRPGTARLLRWLLPRVGDEAIVVVDALALSCLTALGPDAVRPLAGRLLLSPNKGECRALVPDHRDEDERSILRAAAERFGAVVTTFGDVADPDGRAWCDPRTAPGLATSGSGDVLAGLLGGLAARCQDAAQAACWGTYAHIGAGVALAERVGPVGYLARDLADEVAPVIGAITPSP